jgi:hypothetical protein
MVAGDCSEALGKAERRAMDDHESTWCEGKARSGSEGGDTVALEPPRVAQYLYILGVVRSKGGQRLHARVAVD